MIKKFSSILAVFADKLVSRKSALTGKGRFMALSLFFVVFVSVLTTVVINTIYTHEAVAAPNTTVNFQARILTNTGALVADGNYNVQFKVYNSLAGPTSQWNETQVVSIKNGYASVSLGAVNAFGSSIDWSQEQWLTMNINGDGEMAPRMKVTGVPLAFRAVQSETLTNGAGTISASQLAQLAPGSVQGVSSANAALRINQTGAGSLLQLQSAGVDKLIVANNGDTSIGGSISVASGVTIGDSSSTTAGTIRWTGTNFEGYNGTSWGSLGGLVLSSGAAASFVSGLQNVGANLTGAAVETLVFTSATAVSNTAGITGFTAPSAGSFRTCLVKNNAAITAGTLNVRWRVNGASVGAGACTINATANRQSAASLDAGVVKFNAGDTIGIAFDTVALAPTTDDFTVYWTVEYDSSSSSLTMQKVYDASPAPVSVVTADNKDINYTLSNNATDSNFLVNIATGSTSKFAVQDNGTDIININNSGVTLTGPLTVNGQAKFNGDVIAGGLATATTGTTAAPAKNNVTAVTLTAAGSFANNDVIYINNAGQDYYTRIVSGGGTVNLVVSPVVSYDAGASVTKYTVQSIGATSNDYLTKANRFFQGYFLGGIVVGAGSTTISDGNIDSTTTLTLQKNGGALDVGGALNVTGAISGDGSGLTNIDGSQISNGSIADLSLSSNVTLLGNTFNGLSQLVQLDGSGYLPALNGSALTSLSGTNITTGTVADARLSANVTLLGNTFNGNNQLLQLNGTGKVADTMLSTNITAVGNSFNGISQLVQLNASGALPALNGSSLISLNGTNITTGTVADARLSANVTLLGNTFNGNNQLVQLNASGTLPTLNGSNLTTINATNISSGTIADLRLSSNVTLLGNIFNGNNQLIQLNASGQLPVLSGVNLTNLNATNIASGTVADGRLSTNVTLKGNAFNGISQLLLLDSSGNLPALNGSALTSLSGTNITSGTVADGRLSTNVTLLGNTFNGNNQLLQLNSSGQLPTLSGVNLSNLNATNLASGTISDTRLSTNVILLNQNAVLGSLVLGNDTTPTAGILQLNDATASNGFKISLTSVTALTANRNINLPDEGGTICLSNSNNCGYIRLASGSAQTDSTTNDSLFINKTGASGNMITLQDNGTSVFIVANDGSLEIRQTSTTALAIKNASGTDFFNIDTSGAIVRIGASAADGTGTLLVLDTKNTTGDPGGVDGGSYYNSATRKTRCYENSIWTDCISAVNRNKPANQTITNNATFQNDSDLSYAMIANASYAIEATINYSTTSATADFKYTFTIPTGATIYLATDADTAATTRTICNITVSGQTCALANTAGFRGIIKVKGIVTTAGTAGSLQFQFAQNTLTAAQSVTVYKGSLLGASRTDQ